MIMINSKKYPKLKTAKKDLTKFMNYAIKQKNAKQEKKEIMKIMSKILFIKQDVILNSLNLKKKD